MSMRWDQLLSSARFGSTSGHEPARSAFHKDYDRIIFSQRFRQLNRKTQVHPLTNHEGIHTRLTHSLEVSCVGRSLGMLVAEQISDQLPDGITPADLGVIVQAACLAHDIGNPPFGHAGEYAIRDWFENPKHARFLSSLTREQQFDLLLYEGNAHGFRLLTKVENHPGAGGMRLTAATLGAFLKYPWSVESTKRWGDGAGAVKFGCNSSERSELNALSQELGLLKTPAGFARHPLNFLLEAADDICYALIDLEDGIALGMLDYRDVEPIFRQIIGADLPDELGGDATRAIKLAALRGRAMNQLVQEVSEVFVAKQDQILRGELSSNLLGFCSAPTAQAIKQAKSLAKEQIFNHPQKARLELIAAKCLHVLLDAFIPLALTEQTSGFGRERLSVLLSGKGIKLSGDTYTNIMLVLDMITEMTDHQAYQLAQELQGIYSGMV